MNILIAWEELRDEKNKGEKTRKKKLNNWSTKLKKKK